VRAEPLDPLEPGLRPYRDWDEMYEENATRVYRLLYSKVGNRADAEDLTAEVFLAVLRPMRLDAARPEVRGYLAATARTVLANHWRRRVGHEVTTIELASALRFLDEPQLDSGAGARVGAMLAELPDRYRRILELRFLESRSIKEAAMELGVTVANAKVLQHRALRMARSNDGEVTS